MDKKRRGFLRKMKQYFAVAGTTAVVATAAGYAKGHAVAVTGAENVQEELKRLNDAYNRLDRKTQIIFRISLVIVGLDLLDALTEVGGVVGTLAAEASSVTGAAS